MDEQTIDFAARQKLTRVASYRQIQGYSKQLFLMTRNSTPRVSVPSFALSEDFTVRPVAANEGRKTVTGANRDISYIVNKDTNVRTPILPPVLEDAPFNLVMVPLLVLMLDQGSPGEAGVAFMMFFLH